MPRSPTRMSASVRPSGENAKRRSPGPEEEVSRRVDESRSDSRNKAYGSEVEARSP